MTPKEMSETMRKADVLIQNNMFDILAIWMWSCHDDYKAWAGPKDYEPVMTLIRYTHMVPDKAFQKSRRLIIDITLELMKGYNGEKKANEIMQGLVK